MTYGYTQQKQTPLVQDVDLHTILQGFHKTAFTYACAWHSQGNHVLTCISFSSRCWILLDFPLNVNLAPRKPTTNPTAAATLLPILKYVHKPLPPTCLSSHAYTVPVLVYYYHHIYYHWVLLLLVVVGYYYHHIYHQYFSTTTDTRYYVSTT